MLAPTIFNRVFNDFDFPVSFFENSNSRIETSAPSSKVVERENEYVVTAELCGIKKENVNIEYNDGNLVLSAENKTVCENDGNEKVLYNSFSHTRYKKSFYLKDIDIENASATLKDGLLKIVLPKNKVKNCKKIDVK